MVSIFLAFRLFISFTIAKNVIGDLVPSSITSLWTDLSWTNFLPPFIYYVYYLAHGSDS